MKKRLTNEQVNGILDHQKRNHAPKISYNNSMILFSHKNYLERTGIKSNLKVTWYDPIDGTEDYICQIGDEYFRVPHKSTKRTAVYIGGYKKIKGLVEFGAEENLK